MTNTDDSCHAWPPIATGITPVRCSGAQRERDRVEVPGLSPQAWTAEQRLEGAIKAAVDKAAASNAPHWTGMLARQDASIPAVWAKEVLGQAGVEAELLAVQKAAGKRLGEDQARALMRQGRSVSAGPGPRDGVGWDRAGAGCCRRRSARP